MCVYKYNYNMPCEPVGQVQEIIGKPVIGEFLKKLEVHVNNNYMFVYQGSFNTL